MDCGLLKQMKELEQEKEVLLQGLEMMAETRLVPAAATSAGAPVPPGSEQSQRRLWGCREPRPLGRLLPKVQEVARCLGELLAAACASRALPTSFSGPLCPALTSTLCPGWQQQTILMLKEQNRRLIWEVTEESGRIMQLEQKSA
ncbi:hypothetical protein H8958_007098 [Nasalis larvatus]